MSNLSDMGCGDVYPATEFESGLSKTCRIIPSRWVTADKGSGVQFTFLVGDTETASFPAGTGRGPHPKYVPPKTNLKMLVFGSLNSQKDMFI